MQSIDESLRPNVIITTGDDHLILAYRHGATYRTVSVCREACTVYRNVIDLYAAAAIGNVDNGKRRHSQR